MGERRGRLCYRWIMRGLNGGGTSEIPLKPAEKPCFVGGVDFLQGNLIGRRMNVALAVKKEGSEV